jgi:hypothetical protein
VQGRSRAGVGRGCGIMQGSALLLVLERLGCGVTMDSIGMARWQDSARWLACLAWLASGRSGGAACKE